MIQYIQMLRFGAAMWVALYHARHAGFFPSLPGWMQYIVNGGYAGVDVFFVISGLIMALTTRATPAGPRQAGQFLLTRFARIYTGWWPAMLLYYLVLRSTNALPAGLDMVATTLLYPTNFNHHISAVIWTLVFELYFYILIALSLLLPRTWRDGALAALFACLLATDVQYFNAGRFAPEMFSQANLIIIFYAAPLVLEFFAGYFLYRLLCRFPRQDWRLWLLATLALGSWAIYFALFKTAHAPGLAGFYHWPERALFIGLPACALVGTAMLAPIPTQAPAQWLVRWLAQLGEYSFAIYLLHLLVFQVMVQALHGLNPNMHHRSIMTAFVMAVLVVCGALYHHQIEHPLYQYCRRKIRQWFTPQSPSALHSSA